MPHLFWSGNLDLPPQTSTLDSSLPVEHNIKSDEKLVFQDGMGNICRSLTLLVDGLCIRISQVADPTDILQISSR